MLYISKWKAVAILLTALIFCLLAVPNFFPESTIKRWPAWAQRHIVLGLDLQGGSHILLEVDANDVRKQKLWIYALSGLFAAAAGLVLAGRLGSAGPQAAVGYELDAIAAVVIGGASLSGGVGRATGTLVGALVLAVLRNGLNLLQVPPFWQQVVIGAVIALAALLDSLRRR